MVVDAHGRLVPVQEHLTATALAPVIRKGIPTDWPRPTPVPSHEDAGVPDVRPPELEREAQIAPLRSEPFEKPAEVKRSWLSRHGTDLMIVTSGAFLVPAQRAGRHGLNWFSVIFASQAVICGIYHYCDQHRVGTELNGPVCSDQSYRFWHLADHGMAYFVMLQMGFLLLGPEDPILRRFSPWTSVEHPPFAGNAGECHEPDATGSFGHTAVPWFPHVPGDLARSQGRACDWQSCLPCGIRHLMLSSLPFRPKCLLAAAAERGDTSLADETSVVQSFAVHLLCDYCHHDVRGDATRGQRWYQGGHGRRKSFRTFGLACGYCITGHCGLRSHWP